MEASFSIAQSAGAAQDPARDSATISESVAALVARASDLRDDIQLAKTDLKASSGRTLANPSGSPRSPRCSV
jgi:hypothetical protein